MEQVEQRRSTFSLPEKIVRVVPIVRNGTWLPEGHDGQFMYTGTTQRIPVPRNGRTGQLIDPLTSEEREYLEQPSVLSMREGDLSIYRDKKENFWGTFEIRLNKNGDVLDLSNPMQYIRYKVLLTNSELIAPSFEERFDKATYRWMLVDTDHEVKEKANAADLMQSVYMEFGAIKNSKTKLKSVLKIHTNKTVAKNAKLEWLIGEVKGIIDEDPNGFISILTDPNFEMRTFVESAVDAGAIIKVGKNKYAFTGEPDDVYNMTDLIDELDPQGANQHKYLKIKTQIEEFNS